MIDQYIQKNRKVLRRGYTTGTCAAAAAKAAAQMLFSGDIVDSVSVDLPAGNRVALKVREVELCGDTAKCCVVKDAGDDPDITHGARICAMVRKNGRGVSIRGGDGIGTVTKRGLQVSVGDPAINPVPRKMILKEVGSVLPNNQGVEVTIFVPEGRKLARRTMNKKLGIVGGISIIGTTGIVKPMSDEAFRESLIPQIDIALAEGYGEVVLTPGNIGERNAVRAGVPGDAVIQTGNFVGFIVERCCEKGVKKALLFGHMGKLTKIAGGVFNTHSRVADARLEIIAAHASLLGADKEITKLILGANTTERALEVLRKNNLNKVLDLIAEKASFRAMEYVDNKMEIGTIILSINGEVVGRDKNARRSRWARFLL